MRPISSKFLKGTATYKPVTGKDAFQKPTYGTPVNLTKIYYEAPKRNALSSLGEQAQDQLVLFHDVRRSRPRGQVYAKGDVVAIGSEEFTVREAQLFPTPVDPHHWEVRLT